MNLRSKLAIARYDFQTRSAWRYIHARVADYQRRRAAHVARRDAAIKRARELERRIGDLPLDERVRASGEMCILLTRLESEERLLAAEGSYLNAILDGLENGMPAPRRDSSDVTSKSINERTA